MLKPSRTILILCLLTTTSFLAAISPTAMADHDTGHPGYNTDAGYDYLQQLDRAIQLGSYTDGSCATPSSSRGIDDLKKDTKVLISSGAGASAGASFYTSASVSLALMNTGLTNYSVAVSSNGVISGDGASQAKLIKHVNTTTSFWFVLEWTPHYTGGYQFHGSSSDQTGCGVYPSLNLTLQTSLGGHGSTEWTRLTGLVARWKGGVNNSGEAPAVAILADMTRTEEQILIEDGIEGTEVDGWPDYKFNWQEINTETTTIPEGGGSNSTGGATYFFRDHPAQVTSSFRSHIYQTQWKFRIAVGAATCTGLFSFSVRHLNDSTSLSGLQSDITKEVINITGYLTTNGTSANADLYITPSGVWSASPHLVYFNNTTATYSAFGVTRSTPAPSLPTLGNRAFTVYSAPSHCGNVWNLPVANVASGNAYGGNTYTAWTAYNGGFYQQNSSLEDFNGYQGIVTEHPTALYTKQVSIVLNQHDVGGGYYAFMREQQGSGTMSSYLSNASYYGASTDYSLSNFINANGITYGNASYRIEAVRLLFDTVPRNASGYILLTFDFTQTFGNRIWFGQLQNQNFTQYGTPSTGTHPHVREIDGTGYVFNAGFTTFNIYRLQAVDTFTVTLRFTIVNCVEFSQAISQCVQTGTTRITNGAFAINNSRDKSSGFWHNAGGNFNITGQYLKPLTGQTDAIQIILSRAGDPSTFFNITNVTNFGEYHFTLGMAINGTTLFITGTTRAIICTPNPGTFIVPNPAEFSCTKNFEETVFYGVFKYESSGLPVIRSQVYPMTSTLESIRYPLNGPTFGTAGVSNHTGQYLLSFTDGDSNVMQVVRFVICSTNITCSPQGNVNTATNQSVSTQMENQVTILAGSSSNALTETQTTRNKVLSFADFFYGSYFDSCDCLLDFPNGYWFLIAMAVLAAASIVVRRRNGDAS